MILLLIILANICRHIPLRDFASNYTGIYLNSILLNSILFGVVCDVHHMVDVLGYETGLDTPSRVAAYTCACRATFFLSNA